jgi:hypothetical protein
LEKIVYGTVSILLTSIIGSIAYAFVGVKQWLGIQIKNRNYSLKR